MADKVETPLLDYAFWDFADQSLRVVYSLPLFHEIDFMVNEGYRKIPHGGIETAGLLFGTIGENEVRIDALRPIECEHAAGPSLNFSEKDLRALEIQIQASMLDRELEKYKPIGWFLGHTRSGLEMTEMEAKHFDRFFPGPGNVAIVVKPERFQPTRFACLVRPATGPMPCDGLPSAIILPLPGRSSTQGQLVSSIPAPAAVVISKPTRQAEQTDLAGEEEPDEEALPAKPELPDIWKTPTKDPERPDHRKLARERARLIEQAYALPEPSPIAPVSPQPAHAPPPFRPAPLPSLPRGASRYLPSPGYEEAPLETKSMVNARSVTALALAALLGCVVGYIAYLQLPAPIIPIDVRPLNQTILVSWPPDETRNAMYAAIRLNDGSPMPLSAQEKKTGQVAVTAARDFKLELVARNWVRDSRGIVRYLRSSRGAAQTVPVYSPPSP